MRIDGMKLAFLDIPAEYTHEYNRWYDLDHIAEHVSKPDVVMGRRYVAPAALRDLPSSVVTDTFGGHAPYLTIYSFGGPLDMMSEEATAGWRTMDRGIVKQGRFWMKGRSVGGGAFTLREAIARPGCLVSEPAIPHLAHRGLIVACGRAPSAARRQEAVTWWRETHLVDLFTAQGVLAALCLDPVGDEQDLVAHVLLCEDAPATVMPRISAVLRYQSAMGRFPAYGGVYEPLCFLPYDRIVPLEYDFDFGTT